MLHLEEIELRDLAMFFARRFPDAEQRVPLLAAARLNEPPDSGDAVTVWTAILAGVQGPRQLRALTRAAQQLAPGDENLQDVCRILQPPPSRLGSAAAIASGVACALIVAAVAVPAMRSPSAVADAPAPAAEASFVSAAAMAPAPDAVVATNITPPRANLQIISKTPTSRNDANPEPRLEDAAPTPPSTSTSGRCRAAEGELIGYWYAGAEAPGAAGETISAPITANVRADYPDTHNGYDARAAVRCLILEGDRITLSSDPIAVPGERYWVPLRGGDIR